MKNILTYIFLILISIYIVLPIYVFLVTSFKDLSEVSIDKMWDLPRKFSLYGFSKAFSRI